MKRAVIVSNGTIVDYEYISSLISDDDFVICADGAAAHLRQMGITPDVWIGDYDSCKMSEEEFCEFADKSEIIRLNPVKDATDTEAACNYIIERGFQSVIILGAIGTRFDHSLANVMLLSKLENAGVSAKIINENNIIFLAKSSNVIEKDDFENISVIPLSETLEGVTVSGMYYNLDNANMNMNSSLGISNKLICDRGVITIKKGKALIILSKD